jgi:hypothetical protein
MQIAFLTLSTLSICRHYKTQRRNRPRKSTGHLGKTPCSEPGIIGGHGFCIVCTIGSYKNRSDHPFSDSPWSSSCGHGLCMDGGILFSKKNSSTCCVDQRHDCHVRLQKFKWYCESIISMFATGVQFAWSV